MKKQTKADKKEPVGRPRMPLTPSHAMKDIEALDKLLEREEIDIQQYHILKDAVILRLTEGR